MISSARVTRNSRFADPRVRDQWTNPKALGRSRPLVSRGGGIRASAHQLQALLERDLTAYDLVAVFQPHSLNHPYTVLALNALSHIAYFAYESNLDLIPQLEQTL